jgi:hypothetical protein
MTEDERLAEAMQGDPGAGYDETHGDPEVGAVGPLGAQALGECAERLTEIGRTARCDLGDRIEELAELVHELAIEARHRLAADRAADAQRAAIAEEHERRRRAAAEAAAPEQQALTGFVDGGAETFG